MMDLLNNGAKIQSRPGTIPEGCRPVFSQHRTFISAYLELSQISEAISVGWLKFKTLQ